MLLPGLDGTGDLFAPLVATVPDHLAPVVVCLPELSSYEALLEGVRHQLPAGRFVVLGESFSGPLAVEVARAEPDRVVAVILCNSFVSPPKTSMLRYLPWSLVFAIPPPRWVLRRFFVGPNASAGTVSAVREALGRTPGRVLAHRMRAVFSLPAVPNASRLQVPVLSLAGTNDLLVSNNLRALEALAPDVVCKRITAPHLLLQVAPQAAWAEISAFLAQVG